ncbi:MAG: putative secondary metabolism biosynthetic enzyme [Pycnora praestabilis]|nr:MAG: putative secondary metabolism biosynthetic enzyme [Pycnora praestabilis]
MAPTKMMKAAQYHPTDKKVRINEIPIPQPAEDEILIKTVAASICHSDLMLVDGQIPASSDAPITIGHEATGRVVSVGRQVKGFKKGDNIGFINAYHACFECEGCQQHYTNCSSGRMTMQGFTVDGYFQEYCIIDQRTAIVLPKNMDPAVASPIFCAGITAYQGVLAARIKPGQSLAVIGCGGLGQLASIKAIRYAKAKGYKVIAIDIDEATLQMARESGANYTFNSRSNKLYIDEILKVTSGGCEAAAVFAAAKAGYDTAPKVLRVGGHLVCVGIPPVDITLSAFDITMKKYHVFAANNHALPRELRECAEFTSANGISSPSKFFKLEQINEMIQTMAKEKMGGSRLVVRFEDEGPEAARL